MSRLKLISAPEALATAAAAKSIQGRDGTPCRPWTRDSLFPLDENRNGRHGVPSLPGESFVVRFISQTGLSHLPSYAHAAAREAMIVCPHRGRSQNRADPARRPRARLGGRFRLRSVSPAA